MVYIALKASPFLTHPLLYLYVPPKQIKYAAEDEWVRNTRYKMIYVAGIAATGRTSN